MNEKYIKRKVGMFFMFGGWVFFFYNLAIMSPLLIAGLVVSLLGYMVMES